MTEDPWQNIEDNIKDQYINDPSQRPWVIAFSGGKDSTTTLQLVWHSLVRLPPEKLKKPIYVISTDTLVENPIVAAWVSRKLR